MERFDKSGWEEIRSFFVEKISLHIPKGAADSFHEKKIHFL